PVAHPSTPAAPLFSSSLTSFALPPVRNASPTRRSSDLADRRGGRDRAVDEDLSLAECITKVVEVLRLGAERDRQKHDRATPRPVDRKSTRLNSSHSQNSYAVFCLKKKKQQRRP